MASLSSAFLSARSALNALGSAISVRANNIANVATPGFKPGRPELTTGSGGRGPLLEGVRPLLDQGTILPTSRSLDLALSGDGYFVLGEGGERSYSRNGAFEVGPDGTIVDSEGRELLGFPEGGGGALAPLSLSGITSAVVPTSEIAVAGNVDALADAGAGVPGGLIAAGDPPLGGPEPVSQADLLSGAVSSVLVEAVDSLGNTQPVTLSFFDTGGGTVEVAATIRSELVDPSGAATGAPRLLGVATLQFGADGQQSGGSASTLAVSLPLQNGATSDFSADLSGFTRYSRPSGVESVVQNGKTQGEVVAVSVAGDGGVSVTLTNGEIREVGTAAVARFPSPEELTPLGGNAFEESADSGPPVLGVPGTGEFPAIEGGALELSTVDLPTEIVSLVSLEQAFLANLKVMDTLEELMDEVVDKA